ncbi:MAG: hypothetical protein ACO2PN_25570 [Pyrobaculum sp.]
MELLTRRGLIIINIEDFQEMEHLVSYTVSDGDLRLTMAIPQVVCMTNSNGAWVKVYGHIVKSVEEFHEMRRFLEAKLHWLKIQYQKMCFETRGRKRKEKEEEPEKTGKRQSRRKKKQGVEEEI